MPKDITEPPYKHNKTLFTVNSHPMHFFMRPCKDRRKLKGLIEADIPNQCMKCNCFSDQFDLPIGRHGGGILDGRVSPNCIRLAPEGFFVGDQETVSTDFVVRSVLVNKPLNTADFMLTKPVKGGQKLIFDNEDDFDKVPKKATSNDRKKWNKFTLREDEAMLKYMETHRKTNEISGYLIYKEMSHKKVIIGHTVQSMNNRFRKTVINQLDKYPSISDDFKALLRTLFGKTNNGTLKKGVNKKNSESSQRIQDSDEDDNFGLPCISSTRSKTLERFGPNAKSYKPSMQQKEPSKLPSSKRSKDAAIEDVQPPMRITRTSLSKRYASDVTSNGSINVVEKNSNPPLASKVPHSKNRFLLNFELQRTSPSTQNGPDLSKNKPLLTQIEGPLLRRLPKIIIDDAQAQEMAIQSSETLHKSLNKTSSPLENSSAKKESPKRSARILSKDEPNPLRKKNFNSQNIQTANSVNLRSLQSEPYLILSRKSSPHNNGISENWIPSDKHGNAKAIGAKHVHGDGSADEGATPSKQTYKTRQRKMESRSKLDAFERSKELDFSDDKIASKYNISCNDNSSRSINSSPARRGRPKKSTTAEGKRPKPNTQYANKKFRKETTNSCASDEIVISLLRRTVSDRVRTKRPSRNVKGTHSKNLAQDFIASDDECNNSAEISELAPRRSSRKSKMADPSMAKDIYVQNSKRNRSNSSSDGCPMSDRVAETAPRRSSRRDKVSSLNKTKFIDLRNAKRAFHIASSSSSSRSNSSSSNSNFEEELSEDAQSKSSKNSESAVRRNLRNSSRWSRSATRSSSRSSVRKSDELSSKISTGKAKAVPNMAEENDLQNDGQDENDLQSDEHEQDENSSNDDDRNSVRKPKVALKRRFRRIKMTGRNSATDTSQSDDFDSSSSSSNSDGDHVATRRSNLAIRRSTRNSQSQSVSQQLFKKVFTSSDEAESGDNDDPSFYGGTKTSNHVTSKKLRNDQKSAFQLTERATRSSSRMRHSNSHQRKRHSPHLAMISSSEDDDASAISDKSRAYLRRAEKALAKVEGDSSPGKGKLLSTPIKSDQALRCSPRRIRNALLETTSKETKPSRTSPQKSSDIANQIEEIIPESELDGISLDNASLGEGSDGNVFSHSGEQTQTYAINKCKKIVNKSSTSPEDKIKPVNNSTSQMHRSPKSVTVNLIPKSDVSSIHKENLTNYRTPEAFCKIYPLRRKVKEVLGDSAEKRKSTSSPKKVRAVKRLCSISDDKPDGEPEMQDEGWISDASTIPRQSPVHCVTNIGQSSGESKQNSSQTASSVEVVQVAAHRPDEKMDEQEDVEAHKTKISKGWIKVFKQLAPTKHTLTLLPLTEERLQSNCSEANVALKPIRKRLVLDSVANGLKTPVPQRTAISSPSNSEHQDERESIDKIAQIASSELQTQPAEELLLICASGNELKKIRSRGYKQPSMCSLGHIGDTIASATEKAHSACFDNAISKVSDACSVTCNGLLGLPCTIFQRALKSAVNCSDTDGKPSFGDTLLIIQWLSKLLHLSPSHLLYILKSSENENCEVAQHL